MPNVYQNKNSFVMSVMNNHGSTIPVQPGERIVGNFFARYVGPRGLTLVGEDQSEAPKEEPKVESAPKEAAPKPEASEPAEKKPAAKKKKPAKKKTKS